MAVIVISLFSSAVGLQFVIVVFRGHTPMSILTHFMMKMCWGMPQENPSSLS